MKNRIKHYFSLVKIEHTVFALPFALTGALLALYDLDHHYDSLSLFFDFIIIISALFFARNAAMGFNRWTDRKIDAKNDRTASRELPAGTISSNHALLFVIINSLLFISATALLNTTALLLSPIALLVILGYSYTKRFTNWSHIFLGLSLATAPAGAYVAICETLTIPILFLSSTVLFWSSGFDIIYSLQDIDFDRAHKLHSVPSRYGINKALLISNLLHVCAAVTILFFCYLTFPAFGWFGVAAATLFILSLIYQHTLVFSHDLSKINIAFFTTNGIASLLYFSILFLGVLLH